MSEDQLRRNQKPATYRSSDTRTQSSGLCLLSDIVEAKSFVHGEVSHSLKKIGLTDGRDREAER